MTHINLNTISCTHIEHSPTKIIYISYCMETHACTHAHIEILCRITHTVGDTVGFRGSLELNKSGNSLKIPLHEICIPVE